MSKLVQPHGSQTLKPLLLTGAACQEALQRAAKLPAVKISSREMGDLIMLGIGGFTPLNGFMNRADWLSVCNDMQLADGLFWPVPITLSTDETTAAFLKVGQEVALVEGETQQVVGILQLEEKYKLDKNDKKHECLTVFKTNDENHPGVKMVYQQGEVNLAGSVQVLSEGDFPKRYPGIYLRPDETRALFESKGWSTVAAFQTRNPMHRSHEHLVKIALEVCDGVLIHSLLGKLKPGDIPADVRQEAISVLLEHYFVKHTVVQSGYPLDMRYAGPREALLHALFRQNYGCSHLIVGRDHAGVGEYYGPFDAQHIFDEIPENALLTKPLKIDWAFWCNQCNNMSTLRSCPHDESSRVLVSGTKLRKALSEGDVVPEHFSRPEVLKVLRAYYEQLAESDKVKVELTGHSAR